VCSSDLDLGRAHGEIIITADTSGADQAAASLAAVDAESKLLNDHMRDVEQALNKQESQMGRTGQQAYRYRAQIEDLRNSYNRFHTDYQRAQQRSTQIH
jgi:chromosome segregation ATPase